MKYRMVKVDVGCGESVWFEAQHRVLLFWRNCFHKDGEGVRYRTWECAADAIHRHKAVHGHVKRTVVRNW